MSDATFPMFPADDDAIARWARLAPTRTAVVEDGSGRRITYAELDVMTARWAARLLAHGVGAGDRVALLAATCAECVALFYGCVRIGAALVPLNWRLAAPELARVVDDAAVAALVLDDRHAPLAERVSAVATRFPGTRLALSGAREDESLGAGVHAGLEFRPGPETPTMILYTSGSTGAPKGVVLPRRQLLYNAVATTVGWRLGPDDVGPVSTPLFHTGGWHVLLTPLLHVGATVALFDVFEPDRFLAGLAAHGCTIAFAVPTQLTMLLASPTWGVRLERLRYFISGGAPCPPSVQAAVRASGYGMRQGYGLTECGPNCFATNDVEADAHPDSVGWPMPFLEMRLAREDGSDADVGEAGELLLRGPQMFAGYHAAPQRTHDALAAGGWLRTGDLASRDADGRFTIRGRRKEMFISGGENVFPGEVEAALCDVAGVAEACVVGVGDAKWGEVGHAFVVARSDAALDEGTLLAGARARLAGYKVPKRVTFCAELPRLGSGKVDRAAVVRDASQG